MSLTTPKQVRNIYPLTGIRILAAGSVLFHHTAKRFLPAFTASRYDDHSRSLLAGLLFRVPIAVSFFILLSGYVLSMVYLRNWKPQETRNFFIARFARIYPLYVLTLLLDTPHTLMAKVRYCGVALGALKTAGVLLAYFVMLQGWHSSRFGDGIDGPNVTLSAEIFFYLCFPVLGVWLWKLRGRWLLWVAAGLYVGGQLFVLVQLHRPLVSMVNPLTQLSTFFLGVLLARWQTLRPTRKRTQPADVGRAYLLLAAAALSVVASAWFAVRFDMLHLFYSGLLAPFFAAVIWALSTTPTTVSRVLCTRWMFALGNASFAVYLIHMPLLRLFDFLDWLSPATYPAYLAACLVLSLLSFRYFETPVRKWLVAKLESRPPGAFWRAVTDQASRWHAYSESFRVSAK